MNLTKQIEFGSALDLLSTASIGSFAVITKVIPRPRGQNEHYYEAGFTEHSGIIQATTESQAGGVSKETGLPEPSEINATTIWFNGGGHVNIDWDRGHSAFVMTVESKVEL